MRLLLLLTFFSPSLWTSLLAGENPFSEGVKAHGEKNFTLAAQKFTEAILVEENNSSAYFNLGLAEMGNRHFGSAIWAFEKVLKFDPNDGEALERLEHCQDELDPSKTYDPVLSGFKAALYGLSSDTWSIIAVTCSILLCLCIVLFKMKPHPSLRRIFLITGFFSLITMLFSIWTASASAAHYRSEQYGIVVQPLIPTYLDNENVDNTQLKEGTRLRLTEDREGVIIRVKDQMGHEYLVKRSDLRYF